MTVTISRVQLCADANMWRSSPDLAPHSSATAMPATFSPKKRPRAKKMAARRPPSLKTKAASTAPTSRPRRFSAKQILSDKAADFFNAFLE